VTEKEANDLANHIARWSANDQVKNHKEGLNPDVKPIGDGDLFVVILKGKYNYHVWSWQNWRQDFEPDLMLEEEEEIA
jgi:hypothetical protein